MARRFKTANQAVRASRLDVIEKSGEQKCPLDIQGHKLVSQLLAEFELLGDCLVAVQVSGLEVIQQTPPLADHHQ